MAKRSSSPGQRDESQCVSLEVSLGESCLFPRHSVGSCSPASGAQLKKSRSQLAMQGASTELSASSGEDKFASSRNTMTSNSSSDDTAGWCVRGVPDDIMVDILSRAPLSSLAFSLRHVSRAWRSAVSSEALRATRATRGRLEQWLFVLPELPKGGPFRAFDPETATWHTLPPIPAPHWASMEGFACAAAAGKLLVMGGTEKVAAPGVAKGVTSVVSSRVWEFDVLRWEWSEAAPMGTPRTWGAAAAVADRFVYVTGGQGSKSFLKSAEVYDAVARRWCAISPMNLSRCSHRATVVEGRLLVIAGELERHDWAHLQQGAMHPLPVPLGPRTNNGIQHHHQFQLHRQPRPLQNEQRFHLQTQHHGQQYQAHQDRVTSRQTRPVGAAVPDGTEAAHRSQLALPLQSRLPHRGMEFASMEVYDAEADTWVLVPDSWLSGNKVPCPVASVAGELYAVYHSGIHVWDKELGSWHNCGDTPGRDVYSRPHQVSGFGCEELNGKLVFFGGTRDVWINRSRLTEQPLSTVHLWDPKGHCSQVEETSGAAGGLQGVPRGPPAVVDHGVASSYQNHIMLWKEMPPMIGGSGHILASAVVTA